MTISDKWKKRPCVVKYRQYKDKIRKALFDYEVDYSTINIEFIIEQPKSWSKKKQAQMLYEPHQQRPDIDNLLKGFMDAMLEEDSHVHTIKAKKTWGEKGKIILKI